MSKTYTRKIGLNRGKPRLWLEGSILNDNGFTHKAPWTVGRDKDGLYINATPTGDRLIAGAADRPIIDINSTAMLEGFKAGDVVEVLVVRKGRLLVTKVEG
jgi:DNA (cytosine-5)-methyltransferase 1